MDSRLHKASDKDLYKRVLDTLGIIVLVVGLYFAWDQAKQFNRSQNLANWSDVTSRTFDVDKIFIDNPEFQKYFFAGVDTKKGDAEFTKASAIAVIMLDYFDSVMTRLQYNKEHLPEDILQQGAWDHYFDATFRTSPVLCRILMNDPLSYGTEMRRLGVPACEKYYPSHEVASIHVSSVRPPKRRCFVDVEKGRQHAEVRDNRVR